MRISVLDRLRQGPVTRTGAGLVKALERVREIGGLGLGDVDLSGVPPRRIVELARYGLAGKASLLRRHPRPRRLATLLATAVHLEALAIDDALDLFDLLMVTRLLARAERESNNEKLRRYPQVTRQSAKLAAAVRILLESTGPDEEVSLEQVWAAIEAVVSRAELREAVNTVTELAPPVGSDEDDAWRAELVDRIATVRGFVPLLTEAIEFGADPAGKPVLEAMKALPALLSAR